MSELTQLLRAKSMMRYLPANGTAGLARFCESRLSRSPWPPARMTASTLLIAQYILSAWSPFLLFSAEEILHYISTSPFVYGVQFVYSVQFFGARSTIKQRDHSQ